MIALLNLSVLEFSFVVFHDKAKRTQQGNLLHQHHHHHHPHHFAVDIILITIPHYHHLGHGSKKKKKWVFLHNLPKTRFQLMAPVHSFLCSHITITNTTITITISHHCLLGQGSKKKKRVVLHNPPNDIDILLLTSSSS